MYIGGSVDITGRYTHHRYCLRRGIHKTKALQSLWNRDGEEAFVFEQLQLCDQSVLVELEDLYIKNTPSCLNTADGAVTGLNNNVSTQAKRDAAKKRWADPEYRAKREMWLANRVNGRFTRNPHA